MESYVGSKFLKAKPMTRGEYNEYRDWAIPAGENPHDDGYLVEYQDGGEPNDTRHAGYISWSPDHVFEKSYLPMGPVDHLQPHQVRAVAEKAQLDDRIEKLTAFFETDTYKQLHFDEQDRLSHQGMAMQEYSNLLGERIAAFSPPTLTEEVQHQPV